MPANIVFRIIYDAIPGIVFGFHRLRFIKLIN